MEIYLVRHSTPDIPPGVCYGQADIGVTESFEQEVGRLKNILPENARCYSSPLQRCVTMADHLSLDYEIDERLMEMSFGDWEEKKWGAVDQEALNTWMTDFVAKKVPNGESFNDLISRAVDFWEELTATRAPGNYIIYTHGGFIRAVVTHLLVMPPENLYRFHLDFASVTKIGIHNKQFRVEYLNR
ncbi:MAG: alpha-ribazole phosphatase family protein [Bacteroidota bacterium]